LNSNNFTKQNTGTFCKGQAMYRKKQKTTFSSLSKCDYEISKSKGMHKLCTSNHTTLLVTITSYRVQHLRAGESRLKWPFRTPGVEIRMHVRDCTALVWLLMLVQKVMGELHAGKSQLHSWSLSDVR
jgi:hypothetical protein